VATANVHEWQKSDFYVATCAVFRAHHEAFQVYACALEVSLHNDSCGPEEGARLAEHAGRLHEQIAEAREHYLKVQFELAEASLIADGTAHEEIFDLAIEMDRTLVRFWEEHSEHPQSSLPPAYDARFFETNWNAIKPQILRHPLDKWDSQNALKRVGAESKRAFMRSKGTPPSGTRRRGQRRNAKIFERNRLIRKLHAEMQQPNDWAGLARLANDDEGIKALGLPQVSRDVARNAVTPPKKRSRGSKSKK